MPELPEVETVRRGLAPHAEGARIESLVLRRKDLRFPFPADFAGRAGGQIILAIERRAKYLLWHLDGGDSMITHLGMSGSFRIEAEGDALTPGVFHHERGAPGPHDHMELHIRKPGGGQPLALVYNDPRRFGFVLMERTDALGAHPFMRVIGMEPLGNSFDGDALARLFDGKAAPLKAALLDQRLVCGIGNIYACEALWQARLSPERAAGTITRKDGRGGAKAGALASAVREVLARAIEAGGSTLRDHRQADGKPGYFQHSFSVYDREGEACLRAACHGIVRRIVQSGRSTFHCPVCQR
jgi:formamidopyrimidine-DNA glycosylase